MCSCGVCWLYRFEAGHWKLFPSLGLPQHQEWWLNHCDTNLFQIQRPWLRLSIFTYSILYNSMYFMCLCVYLIQGAGCWVHSLWRLTAAATVSKATHLHQTQMIPQSVLNQEEKQHAKVEVTAMMTFMIHFINTHLLLGTVAPDCWAQWGFPTWKQHWVAASAAAAVGPCASAPCPSECLQTSPQWVMNSPKHRYRKYFHTLTAWSTDINTD